MREWNDAYQIIEYNWIVSSQQKSDSANKYFPPSSARSTESWTWARSCFYLLWCTSTTLQKISNLTHVLSGNEVELKKQTENDDLNLRF